MDGHVMRVFSLQFNPSDDNVFVSGGWDDTIQVNIFNFAVCHEKSILLYSENFNIFI